MRIGVMVVDQSPSLLARSVVKNTNTKIIMRLEDGEDIEDMGMALGIDEARRGDLGLLTQGEAVIKTGGMLTPARSGRWPSGSHHHAPKATIERSSPPDYLALERLWTAALMGLEEEPGERWVGELCEASCGSVELAVFALRKALKEASQEPAGRPLPSPGSDYPDLLAFASQAYKAAVRRIYAQHLHDIGGFLIAAASLLPLPSCEVAPSAIAQVASALIQPDDTNTELASGALADLVYADPSSWGPAVKSWERLAAGSSMPSLKESAARVLATARVLVSEKGNETGDSANETILAAATRRRVAKGLRAWHEQTGRYSQPIDDTGLRRLDEVISRVGKLVLWTG